MWKIKVEYEHRGETIAIEFFRDALCELDAILEPGPHYGRVKSITIKPRERYKDDWEGDSIFTERLATVVRNIVSF